MGAQLISFHRHSENFPFGKIQMEPSQTKSTTPQCWSAPQHTPRCSPTSGNVLNKHLKRCKRQCPNSCGRPQRWNECEAAHPLAGGRSASRDIPIKEEEDMVAVEEILLMDLSEPVLQTVVVSEADKPIRLRHYQCEAFL